MTAARAGALVVGCDWSREAPCESLLGPHERRYAEGLPSARRREWARTRLTAKAALVWYTGVGAMRHVQVLPAEDGGPSLAGPGAARLTVSLAHTGEFSVCAATRGGGAALGVDVERVDARNDLILRRVMAHGECAPIRSARPGAESTMVFACKEAAYKAWRGASPGLREYRLLRTGGRVRVLRGPGPGAAPVLTLWPLLKWDLALAVCAGGLRPPTLRVVTPTQVHAVLGGAAHPEEGSR